MEQVEELVAPVGENKTLRYPHLRIYLLRHLVELAEHRDFQREVWASKKGVSLLDLAVHFFFDDFAICDDPQSWINVILWSKEEAEAVHKVCVSLEAIGNSIGWEASDDEWLDSPLWLDLIQSARVARDTILATDHRRATDAAPTDGINS